MSDALGVVPTEHLFKQLKQSKQEKIKHFLSEFEFLLSDDIAEQERQTTLSPSSNMNDKSGAKSKSKKQQQPQQRQMQYMFFPLDLLQQFIRGDDDRDDGDDEDEDLQNFIMSDRSKVDARLRTLFGEKYFQPLQIVFRAAMPTTTADARQKHLEKHKAARANQERQAYNRMMRGANANSNSQQQHPFPGGVNPSDLQLNPNRGGVGFISKDNFSSSSRTEVEEGVSASAEPPARNLIQRISRDVGLGLDVPLMAAAGAVVGYYACMLRGMSDNECAIGAAVCATVFFLVDAGLVFMRVARQDLTSSKQKREAAATVAAASKTAEATASSSSSVASRKIHAPRVIKREDLTNWKENTKTQ